MVGRTLGDFALGKKLGAGGMGEVYQARQLSLDRDVAVKVLPSSIASQEGFEERFRREAKAAANLIHPNVIQVYHIGIDPETHTPYFAMEYVKGEDLQQRMRRMGRLPFEMSIEIMSGVASALAVAYDKGIVHRDLKPSNIMIDTHEIVKVMDFGLAKTMLDKGASNLTQSGIIMGTPNYISPEAGRGDPIDTRSDIYSLGVVFYELLTGALPFCAATPAAIIFKHVYEPPPPPRQVMNDIPPFFEEICLKMIVKEPTERYQSAKQLLKDLNEAKRNMAHYLAGGQRLVKPSGDISGDDTLSASGDYGPPGARENEATQTLGSDTLAAAKGGGGRTAQMTARMGVPETRATSLPGGSKMPIVVGVLLVALGAGGAWVYVNRPQPGGDGTAGGGTAGGGGTTAGGGGTAGGAALGDKVVFPASKLERVVPKGVETYIQRGFDLTPIFYADLPVDAGDYTLVFKKVGFEPLTRTFKVAKDGVQPPLEDLRFEFRPKDDIRQNLESAKRAITEQKYAEAIALLQGIYDIAPDYEPIKIAMSTAKARQAELMAQFNEGQSRLNERRYAEAIEVLSALPGTFSQNAAAKQMIESAQFSIERLKQHRLTFDRQLLDGMFGEAGNTLGDITKLQPAQNLEVPAMRDTLQEGIRLFEAGRTAAETGRYEEAAKAFDALNKIAPNHPQGKRLAGEVRAELDKRMGTAQRIEAAIKAGEAALADGQLETALGEAQRALSADPNNAAGKDLLKRAQGKLGEQQIGKRLAALDETLKAIGAGARERVAALMEMIDATSREGVKGDLDAFAQAGIRVEEAEHQDLAVEVQGGERAVVECVWNVTLAFPGLEGAAPPAKGRVTALSVRQKISLRRSGETWLFTGFEQLGSANVRQ